MNSRTRALLIGSLIGALAGTLAGLLYYNANVSTDDEGQEQLPTVTPAMGLKLGLGLLGLMRLLTD